MTTTEHNLADSTGVRVMADRCETCIFRPGNLMRLRPGRVREMIDEALADDGAIVCHDTLDDDEQAVCRGFYDAHGSSVWRLRLAAGTGAIIDHERP